MRYSAQPFLRLRAERRERFFGVVEVLLHFSSPVLLPLPSPRVSRSFPISSSALHSSQHTYPSPGEFSKSKSKKRGLAKHELRTRQPSSRRQCRARRNHVYRRRWLVRLGRLLHALHQTLGLYACGTLVHRVADGVLCGDCGLHDGML